jgi:prolipoprotein diacylglyceryl transferase
MQHIVWDVSPVIFKLGPLQLRWYGLFFVGSFFVGMWLLKWIFRAEGKSPETVDNLLFYTLIGAVVGARLMHCFAYEPAYYLSHPIEILKVWKGGLASHGGMIGVIVVIYLFAKNTGLSFAWLLSRMTLPGMIVAASVRIGNFFNSEILGLPSDAPWAVVFARVDMVPRHPVQLYESFSYLVILLILLIVYLKSKPDFATRILPGLFSVLVFGARFFLEYFKTRQADYTTNLPFTTGQLLSIPVVIAGIVWIIWAIRSQGAR